MRPNKESVLLKTSAATDIQCSGGVISITGLKKVSKSNILDIKQVKYRAETAQVIRVGTSSYTPTADTVYKVLIGDVNRFQSGWEETLKPYSFRTPVVLTTLGATAALQREAIHLALVAAINADASNKVVAASLLTGTGFSVTDDGSYYPVYSQGMSNVKGVSTVIPVTNTDGSGFAESDYSITTPGVIGVGIGAYLAAQAPVIDFVNNNLVSGVIDTPPLTTTGAAATTGQNYDVFVINSYQTQAAWSVSGQLALVQRNQEVWVDNGTGTSTSNLTGFRAFERELQRAIADLYRNDPSAIYDFFDNGLIASATYPTTGAAITTTDNVVMAAKSSGEKFDWYINPIGTHTLLTPIVGTGGLQPYLDVITQEGVELSPPNLTQNPKQFVVGKSEYSLFVRLDIGSGIAATDFKSLSIGFRKKAAYAVDQTAYEAASVATACLGVPLDTGAAPVINMITGPGAAGALTSTSCAVSPAANAIVDLYLTVDINGVVKFYVNGADKTSLLASSYSFTAGLNIMPFVSFRHGAGGAATPKLVQAIALPSITWRVD